MKKFIVVVLMFFTFVSQPALVVANSDDPLLVLQKYDKSFTKNFLEKMLQKMVNRSYLRGFRYLGDPNDFNHGHILFVEKTSGMIEPVAILYHTQEKAYENHENSPGSKYDYLDRRTRNWIQLLKQDGRVENAKRYERMSYNRENLLWRSYVDYSVRAYREHFTIHENMLDPEILGGEVLFSLQWDFAENTHPGPILPDGTFFSARTISIILPGSKKEKKLNLIKVSCSNNYVSIRDYCRDYLKNRSS